MDEFESTGSGSRWLSKSASRHDRMACVGSCCCSNLNRLCVIGAFNCCFLRYLTDSDRAGRPASSVSNLVTELASSYMSLTSLFLGQACYDAANDSALVQACL